MTDRGSTLRQRTRQRYLNAASAHPQSVPPLYPLRALRALSAEALAFSAPSEQEESAEICPTLGHRKVTA
jgi:hypothetical protein